MKLWLLTQDDSTGYDTYDGVVVAAEDVESAKNTPPWPKEGAWAKAWGSGGGRTWANEPARVRAEYLGEARDNMPAGVVLASFIGG